MNAPQGGPGNAASGQFWTLCSGILLMFVGHTMIIPLAPLYSLELGASPAVIGVVISAAFFFPLLLAVPAGSLVDRYGSRGILIVGTLLVGLSPFLIPLFPGFASLGLVQVFNGLGQLIAVIGAQSYVATLGSGRTREQYFGWYSTFISVGQLLGPLLAGVAVDLLGFEAAFALSGIAASLAVVQVVRLRRTGSPANREPHHFPTPAQMGHLLRFPSVQLALLVSGTMMIPLMGSTSFLPAYLDLLSYPATLIGAVISFRALVTIVVRPFMPRIIAALGGRLRTLTAMTAVCALGLAAIAHGSLWVLLLVAVLMGIGLGIAQPLTMVTVVEEVSAAQRGTVFGVRLTANRFMQVVGPLALGLLAQLVGYRAMFPIAALATAATVLLLVMGRRHFARSEAAGV